MDGGVLSIFITALGTVVADMGAASSTSVASEIRVGLPRQPRQAVELAGKWRAARMEKWQFNGEHDRALLHAKTISARFSSPCQ